MSVLDIQNIINEKVTSMLENKEIQQKIEETVEKELLKAIADSVSNWEVQKILKNKIETEINASVSTLNFSGYTNKIVKQIADIIERNQNKELSEKILKEFNSLYVKPENLSFTVDDLISKYTEYVKDMGDSEYCDKYVYWKIIDDSKGSTYSKFFKIFVSTNEDFESGYDNDTYIIGLQNIDEEFKQFKIYSIDMLTGYGCKDLTKRLKVCGLSSFERLLINAYYNETPIVEVEEDNGEFYLGDD